MLKQRGLNRIALLGVTALHVSMLRCILLLTRMCMNYIELYRGVRSSITQDAKVFDTGAEPSANTKSDLEPIAKDWRKQAMQGVRVCVVCLSVSFFV